MPDQRFILCVKKGCAVSGGGKAVQRGRENSDLSLHCFFKIMFFTAPQTNSF